MTLTIIFIVWGLGFAASLLLVAEMVTERDDGLTVCGRAGVFAFGTLLSLFWPAILLGWLCALGPRRGA